MTMIPVLTIFFHLRNSEDLSIWKDAKRLVVQYKDAEKGESLSEFMEAQEERYVVLLLLENDDELPISLRNDTSILEHAILLPFSGSQSDLGHEYHIDFEKNARLISRIRNKLEIENGSHLVLIDCEEKECKCRSVSR